jgi:hypothetical protein
MNIKLLVLCAVIGFTMMSSASANSGHSNHHQRNDSGQRHDHQQVDRNNRLFSFNFIVPRFNYYSPREGYYISHNHYYNQRHNKHRDNKHRHNKHRHH